MIRPKREAPKRLFRGNEFGRLMTMICMLVVLWMMIQAARDPGTWTWLVTKPGKQEHVVPELDHSPRKVEKEAKKAEVGSRPSAELGTKESGVGSQKKTAANAPQGKRQDQVALADGAGDQKAGSKEPEATTKPDSATNKPEDKTAEKPGDDAPPPAAEKEQPQPAPDKVASKIPAATGPTDEDEDEQAGAEEDFDFVVDNLYHGTGEEHNAYQRLLRWVINQPFERLQARAKSANPPMAEFLAAPKDARGKIFEFEVHAQRLLKFDDKFVFHDEDNPQEPVTYYELWGVTEESRGHLYDFIVFDPPEGMPVGNVINEQVRFVGYFFKDMAYLPAKAPPGGAGELAPVFIGRIAWRRPGPAQALHGDDLPLLFGIIGGLAVLGAGWLGLMYFLTRRGAAKLAPTASVAIPRAVTIDEWLDNSEEQEADKHAAGADHGDNGEPDPDHYTSTDGNGATRKSLGLFDDPSSGRYRDN